MTYIKSTIISLIIITLTGLTVWFSLFSDSTPIVTTQVSEEPDAFMEGVSSTVMNKEGRPKMKIVTPKMVHYPNGDTTQLLSPQLTLYRQSPQPWYISSDFAKATQGIENVDFWSKVTIHHYADTTNPATIIQTNTLTVHPNQKTAETKDEITLTQPNLTVRAIGMHANINTGDIQLLSNPRGEYVPNS